MEQFPTEEKIKSASDVINELVMIVDDQEIHAFAAEIMIKKYKFGNETVAFNSAREALNYLSGKTAEGKFPGVIFLDIHMPEMNGYDFLDEYIKFPEDLRQRCNVVLLSSTKLAEDMVRIQSYTHVARFLEKPLTKDKLLSLA